MKNKFRRSIAPETKEKVLPSSIFVIVCFVMAAAIVAVYSPSLNFQFILDDHSFITDPLIQVSGHVCEYFTSYVWSQIPNAPPSFYRPAFVLWMRLNFILNELSPWGWHLLSILKHLAVAVLLGLLAWKLLRDRIAALIAATLFALHPAQTESVAWITVPDPLMSAAVLGALLLYLKYADRPFPIAQRRETKSRGKTRRKNRAKGLPPAVWAIASAVVCFAALLSKETALVLPFFVLALALLSAVSLPDHTGTTPSARLRIFAVTRQVYPFLIVTVLYLLLRVNALKGSFIPQTQHLPWTTVLWSWPEMLWFYIKVIFWPARSRAFADPTLTNGFSIHGVLMPALGVCCAVAALVGFCAWAWSNARHKLPYQEALNVHRAILLGVLIFILPLVPTLNVNVLNPGDFLHGRYTYLPLAGLMLLLSVGFHLVRRQQIAILSVVTLIVIAFSLLTIMQEDMWKDDMTVFTVGHEIAPNNAWVAHKLSQANVQLALTLDEAGRCNEAMPIFDQAIQQYPQDWFAWAGRGECFFKLNDLPRAEHDLRRAYELSHEPRVAEAWEEIHTRMQAAQ